jgi:hypothetical protein
LAGAYVKAESVVSDNTFNCKETRDQRVMVFMDAQATIDGTLESWLPRLIASNEALGAALTVLMDLYLARQGFPEDAVLRQVEDALKKAIKAKTPF